MRLGLEEACWGLGSLVAVEGSWVLGRMVLGVADRIADLEDIALAGARSRYEGLEEVESH